MGEFRMPSLGADMVAGTLVEWRKRPGDRIGAGDNKRIFALSRIDRSLDFPSHLVGSDEALVL